MTARGSLPAWAKRAGIAIGALALFAPLLASTSCATAEDSVIVGAIDPPAFTTDPEAPDAGAIDGSVPNLLMCDTTECPEGRATCPGDRYPCAADLMTDNLNCGACGNACPNSPSNLAQLNAQWMCVEGSCEMQCWGGAADCNGVVDDGCEAMLMNDPQNCGACGNVCESVCFFGECGCAIFGPNAKACGNTCVPDIQNDDNNCGDCGVRCPRTNLPALNAYVGCIGGTCGHRKCTPFTRDCNGDLQDDDGDGCETPLAALSDDPNNCGECGNVCEAGEICDQGTCLGCEPGEARCETQTSGVPGCFVLTSDPDHCGGCGNACPAVPEGSHAIRTCTEGVCGFECESGFADCDGDRNNGCETNIRIDPDHCGACGHRCPLVGQACLEGQCVQQLCDPEVPR